MTIMGWEDYDLISMTMIFTIISLLTATPVELHHHNRGKIIRSRHRQRAKQRVRE